MIKACIFDLDGVIVDTAKYHFLAWKRLAKELGYDLSKEKNEELKGVSRMDSLDLILQWAGRRCTEEQKQELARQKNEWYLEYINKMKPDEILEGVAGFLEDLRAGKVKAALGSGSKNAMQVIEKLGLGDTFAVVVDGTKTSRSKPDPEVFQLVAEGLGLAPGECIVFEDAAAGIEAARAGGFYAVGIGQEDNLSKAHLVIPNFIGKNFEDILQGIAGKKTSQHEKLS